MLDQSAIAYARQQQHKVQHQVNIDSRLREFLFSLHFHIEKKKLTFEFPFEHTRIETIANYCKEFFFSSPFEFFFLIISFDGCDVLVIEYVIGFDIGKSKGSLKLYCETNNLVPLTFLLFFFSQLFVMKGTLVYGLKIC